MVSTRSARRSRGDRGFTLIELLVVIVILGVLSAVVVFAVSGVTTKAAASACSADVNTVESALEVWHAQNGGYPTPGPTGQTQMTTGADKVLRSWPSSSSYTITLDASVAGQVDVTLPGGSPQAAGAVGQPDPCAALQTGSTTSSSSTSTSTSTTSSTTTTTAPVSNGVTVTPAVSSATNPWYGENQLTIANPAPLTALNITVTVARTTGVNYSGQYGTFWSGAMDPGHTVSTSAVQYTYTVHPGSTIVAGSWLFGFQFSGTGTPRVTSGDTWSVTSTSAAGTSTLTGHF